MIICGYQQLAIFWKRKRTGCRHLLRLRSYSGNLTHKARNVWVNTFSLSPQWHWWNLPTPGHVSVSLSCHTTSPVCDTLTVLSSRCSKQWLAHQGLAQHVAPESFLQWHYHCIVAPLWIASGGTGRRCWLFGAKDVPHNTKWFYCFSRYSIAKCLLQCLLLLLLLSVLADSSLTFNSYP